MQPHLRSGLTHGNSRGAGTPIGWPRLECQTRHFTAHGWKFDSQHVAGGKL